MVVHRVPFGAKVNIHPAKKPHKAKPSHYRSKWPIFTPPADCYVVVLTATLSFEASATATIQVGTPDSVTSGSSITVWCSMLETGESIANGTKGYAKRTPTHYEFFGSRCEEA